MRLTKGSLAGLVLAGILAMMPAAAFAHGGGGGGHGGGGGGHGFGGGGGHGFGRGHGFGGSTGRGFSPGFTDFGYPDYSYYPYSYYNGNGYLSVERAVQEELAELGYYHGPVDGTIGPETQRAIRWFQSVAKIPVTGRIDSATLRALQIS